MTDSLEDREETGMPQPLSRVRKINVMQWGAGCLKKHPDFAAIVAEVIAGWSTAEAEQAQLLANLLDTDLKTGMAMYFSHQSPEPRRKLLAAAAYACFAPGSVERDLFDLIERAIKPIRNQRNAFAHGLWAFSEDIPEALMLVDVDDYVQHRIDNFEKIHESGHADVDFFGADITMVYRKPDFDRALIESRHARNIIWTFNLALSVRDATEREARLRRLYDLPPLSTLPTSQNPPETKT